MMFISKNTKLPPFMIFPKFLMENKKLSDTAKIIYAVLLDRTRLSVTKPEWIDKSGNAFVIYTLENISKIIGKGISSVQRSMDLLEGENLIHRESSGIGCANHIYVMFPDNEKNEKKNDAQTHYSKMNNDAIQKQTTALSENEQRYYSKTNNGTVYSDRNNSKICRNYYDTDEIESLCVNNHFCYSKTNNDIVQKQTTALPENEQRESAKYDISVVQNRTGNNNINNNNAINNDIINICAQKNKKAYGDAKNIFLTDEEHSKLYKMPHFNICLERLSRDLSLTGTEIEDIAPVLERRIKEF